MALELRGKGREVLASAARGGECHSFSLTFGRLLWEGGGLSGSLGC